MKCMISKSHWSPEFGEDVTWNIDGVEHLFFVSHFVAGVCVAVGDEGPDVVCEPGCNRDQISGDDGFEWHDSQEGESEDGESI